MESHVSSDGSKEPKEPVENVNMSVKTGGWSPAGAIIITIGIFILSSYLASLVMPYASAVFNLPYSESGGPDAGDSAASGFLYSALFYILTIVLANLCLRVINSDFRDIGLKDFRISDTVRGILTYVPYFLTYLAAVLILYGAAGIETGQQQETGFSLPGNNADILMTFGALVILPAFAEEILMRGFLYTGLRSGMKKSRAALITAILFGSMHLQTTADGNLLWIAGIDTFVLSLFMTNLREKTGRLWAPISLHFIKNTVAFVSLYLTGWM